MKHTITEGPMAVGRTMGDLMVAGTTAGSTAEALMGAEGITDVPA